MLQYQDQASKLKEISPLFYTLVTVKFDEFWEGFINDGYNDEQQLKKRNYFFELICDSAVKEIMTSEELKTNLDILTTKITEISNNQNNEEEMDWDAEDRVMLELIEHSVEDLFAIPHLILSITISSPVNFVLPYDKTETKILRKFDKRKEETKALNRRATMIMNEKKVSEAKAMKMAQKQLELYFPYKDIGTKKLYKRFNRHINNI